MLQKLVLEYQNSDSIKERNKIFEHIIRNMRGFVFKISKKYSSNLEELEENINDYLEDEYDSCQKIASCFNLVDIKITENEKNIIALLIFTTGI